MSRSRLTSSVSQSSRQQLDQLREELAALKQQLSDPGSDAAAPVVATETLPSAQEEDATSGLVLRRTENGVLRIGGRFHRVLMQVDDGAASNSFFVDSDQGPTMLRVDAETMATPALTVGGTLEVGIQGNRSFRVSQDSRNPGTDVIVRIGEITASHDRYGKLSFGRGFASAWVPTEIDTSGTVPAALLPVGMLSPSMKFVNAADDQLTDISVGTHFIDVERLLLVDRLRYDSVSFGNGFKLSGSVAADDRWDLALRAFPKIDGWTVRGALTYQAEPFAGIKDRVDAGMSARHNDSGLSLTAGVSNSELSDGRDSNSWIVKGGWLSNLNSLGSTGFSVDYAVNEDLRLAGDKAESIGLFALQNWTRVGLNLYAGYRFYDVSRPDINLKKMDVFALGAIYTF